MKRFLVTFSVAVAALTVQAQTQYKAANERVQSQARLGSAEREQAHTQYKVDINEFSRNNMDEVLEPGFTAWRPATKDFNEMTLTMDDGVVFTIRSEHNMRSGWNKAFVQAKEFNCRLTGDGVNLDPNECGSFDLVIKGLSAGTHTIQTVHNSWQDPARFAVWPITVALNGTTVHSDVARTSHASSLQEATVLTTSFTVSSSDDEVVLTFSTTDDAPPADADTKQNTDKTPNLNGFLIDAVNTTAQAKRPNPADDDMHVDADGGTYHITWEAAGDNVVRHRFYFGTDSVAVATAATPAYEGTATEYEAMGLKNLNTYYWRVDEETQDGTVTRGEVWKFRPRHLAFHGAEGYGRFANGGRGGRVVYVTNLNDSGEGSFRWAATELEGPRTILFDVSGIIPLESRLVINKNVTVAGQTAPGKGICFRKNPIGLNHDNIMRFVRMRLGHGPTADGIGMAGVQEGIVDHCSISWTIDEAFSSRNAKNITLQRTLISEALSIANHKNYPEGTDHGFAGSIGGDIGSFHHNLLANCSGRNWSLAGGLDGAGYLQGRLDIFNMVVYNWCRHACYNGAHEVNFVNNYYKRGPATNQANGTRIMLTADQPGEYPGTQRYYFAGNVMPGVFDENSQEKGRTPNGSKEKENDEKWYKQWVDEPFFPSYAKIESARDAYKTVLCDVGANMPVLDDHDVRIVDETLNGTYHYVGSVSGHYGLIDSEEDCGGYEDYGSDVRPADYDTDRDGLPDWWEELFGTNPNSPFDDFSDSNADPDGDGFTALEDYLDWMATPHLTVMAGETGTINLKPWTAGFTTQLTYSLPTVEHLTLNMQDGQLIVTAAADYQGIKFFNVTITDEEGTEMTRRLAVCALDKATGISEASLLNDKGEMTNDNAVYNLHGQRLAAPARGINIVGHRKYIIRSEK